MVGGEEFRVKAGPVNGEEEIRRDGDPSNHVFVDQSLMLKLLPLCCCEWKLVASVWSCTSAHHLLLLVLKSNNVLD